MIVRIEVASWAARGALALIRLYQLAISPLLPAACRFYPSCSQYAHRCVHEHGLWRGAWLSVRRLSRCHPWHPGGIDLPPPGRAAGQTLPPSIAEHAS
jgi:hypothetical protein